MTPMAFTYLLCHEAGRKTAEVKQENYNLEENIPALDRVLELNEYPQTKEMSKSISENCLCHPLGFVQLKQTGKSTKKRMIKQKDIWTKFCSIATMAALMR